MMVEWFSSLYPAEPLAEETDHGSVLVPPCCFPLCCFGGRYYLHNRPDLNVDLHNAREELVELHQELEKRGLEIRRIKGGEDAAQAELRKVRQREGKLEQDVEMLRREASTARADADRQNQ